MNCIVFNKSGGIPRTVQCPAALRSAQVGDNEFVMEGIANDATQKIDFDGFDDEGQPVNPRVVDKTPEEIEADNPTPPEMPFEKRAAYITNEQWRDVLSRLDDLEVKPGGEHATGKPGE